MKYKPTLTGIALLVLPFLTMQALSKEKDIFGDYEQLLPRGGISAIVKPVYVSASEARIKDSSYVLGVVVEGQARAFSLNLLNAHEVVNDKVGDVEFAAVW
jgi:hypothetical protein